MIAHFRMSKISHIHERREYIANAKFGNKNDCTCVLHKKKEQDLLIWMISTRSTIYQSRCSKLSFMMRTYTQNGCVFSTKFCRCTYYNKNLFAWFFEKNRFNFEVDAYTRDNISWYRTYFTSKLLIFHFLTLGHNIRKPISVFSDISVVKLCGYFLASYWYRRIIIV
jgi:hypothetical protein